MGPGFISPHFLVNSRPSFATSRGHRFHPFRVGFHPSPAAFVPGKFMAKNWRSHVDKQKNQTYTKIVKAEINRNSAVE